jgi:repressor LexA
MTLTDRQLQILRSVREWIAEHGETPSVRELAEVVGVSSSSSVAYHLRRMREQGIEVDTRGRRSGRCPYCGH